ncbi:hypothetical protein [Legionella drozanskii]|uniref:Phasin protein n=2 Tax=Legionella TaxID=445 RepID=A0A0W0SRF8_9GAMM|nr:hypothetical protein [Legionella drozanskii]KTC85990.1 hypothetical protein Ldro_2315 [Legionella drozanskii LLAP-1]
MQNKMKDTYKRLQIPMQELVQLNIKTVQSMSYIKPEEWARLRQPQDIFEKQVSVFIENGHKVLDYLEEATEILEKNLFSATAEIRENAERTMREAKSAMSKKPKTTKRKMN